MEEKAENKMISSIRILVEHVISSVKRCRIVHDVLRNTKAHFDDLVMEVAPGVIDVTDGPVGLALGGTFQVPTATQPEVVSSASRPA